MREGFNGVLTILVFLFLFGIVFGSGFHLANEIYPGTFIGNYTFQGNVNITGNLNGGNFGSLPSGTIIEFNSSSCPSGWSSNLINAYEDFNLFSLTFSSSYGVGWEGENIYDNFYSNHWGSDAADVQQLWFNYPNPVSIGQIAITSDASYPTRVPNSFTLKASNTGSFSGEEVTLLTISNAAFSSSISEIRTFNFTNPNSYTYYQFEMTNKVDSFGKGSEYIFSEIDLFKNVNECIKD